MGSPEINKMNTVEIINRYNELRDAWLNALYNKEKSYDQLRKELNDFANLTWVKV
jgi:hypothetical protein